ncbi:DEAD/DEAH box helicase [Intestinibacillus massiliensis]|nr:DEAD/DEAH box helicase [Intestinibacillus massiliensis]
MSNITFDDLQLSESVLHALKDMGFEEPTEIQAKSIPAIREGRDIIGKSHTGTGKTVAFGVPAVECVEAGMGTQVLILCPTRELAMQAEGEMRKLARYTDGVRTVAVYGGEPIQNQIPLLRRGASVVIGTPGRIMDHIDRKTLRLENLKMLVLDEADEMLNMGFREDIETILSHVPEQRQTVLFSATMPPAIMEITGQYQTNPLLIEAGDNSERTIDTVEQYYYEIPIGAKMDALAILLHTHRPKLSIIFCNTKKMVDELARYLNEHGFNASALHGDMKQEARTAVMNSFKSGRTPILIATDVAARGIDVDDVDAVYNFDIPQDYEYYIHRIGRTGRAGREGVSYTLAGGRRQVFQVRDIERYTKAKIQLKALPRVQDIRERRTNELLMNVRTKLCEKTAAMQGADGETAPLPVHPMVEKLLGEGFDAAQLSGVLLDLLMDYEMKDVPVIAVPKPVQKAPLQPTPEGMVRLRFSVGRNQRVAPNQLVGAITEKVDISGKQIGKIYCYGDYSLVELPSKYKQEVIRSLNGEKINGVRADVRLYDNRTPGSSRPSSPRRGGAPTRRIPVTKRRGY